MTTVCSCGAGGIECVEVLHHLACAYVGPRYDFALGDDGYTCPKCDMVFAVPGTEGEVLGHAYRCQSCGAEWLEEEHA